MEKIIAESNDKILPHRIEVNGKGIWEVYINDKVFDIKDTKEQAALCLFSYYPTGDLSGLVEKLVEKSVIDKWYNKVLDKLINFFTWKTAK